MKYEFKLLKELCNRIKLAQRTKCIEIKLGYSNINESAIWNYLSIMWMVVKVLI